MRATMLRMTAFLLAAVLAMPAAAAEAPKWAEAVAEGLWQAMEGVAWDSALRGRLGPSCEEYPGSAPGSWSDEEWCYRCTRAEPTHSAERTYYLFEPAPPATVWPLPDGPGSGMQARVELGLAEMPCRLDQFETRTIGVSSETLREVLRALARRMEEQYGPGEALRGREGHRWRTDDVEIESHLLVPSRQQPELRLRARHRHLVEAIAATERWRQHREAEWAHPAVDGRLAAAIEPSFPAAAGRLREGRSADELGELVAIILELLDRAEAAQPERQALLWLTADRLVAQLEAVDTGSDEWMELERKLTPRGLTFRYLELAGSRFYQHDFLWRVWREHGDTRWGEEAFALLLQQGWDTSRSCREGEDQFRRVIFQGEEFLRRRPESPHRDAVVSALAQAYETWWSLSRAQHHEYADPADYAAGATSARENAVAYYMEVMQIDPGSEEGTYARRRLGRLQLGLATKQQRYYCIYD